MAVATRIGLNIIAELTKTLDLSIPRSEINKRLLWTLTTGTGLNQMDKVWSDTRDVLSGATDTLDFAGVLTDGLGDAATFARIKLFLVLPKSTNTVNLTVTRPAANGVPLFSAAGDACPTGPGGCFFLLKPDATGYVVTASTGDLVDIVNGAAASTYDVIVGGASA